MTRPPWAQWGRKIGLKAKPSAPVFSTPPASGARRPWSPTSLPVPSAPRFRTPIERRRREGNRTGDSPFLLQPVGAPGLQQSFRKLSASVPRLGKDPPGNADPVRKGAQRRVTRTHVPASAGAGLPRPGRRGLRDPLRRTLGNVVSPLRLPRLVLSGEKKLPAVARADGYIQDSTF